MLRLDLSLYAERLEEFCRRWKVTELALFGSVLRDGFGPDSDIDVLISFELGAHWTLLDFVGMQEELEDIFQRKVDLISKRGVEGSRNDIRKRAILDSAKVIYGIP